MQRNAPSGEIVDNNLLLSFFSFFRGCQEVVGCLPVLITFPKIFEPKSVCDLTQIWPKAEGFYGSQGPKQLELVVGHVKLSTARWQGSTPVKLHSMLFPSNQIEKRIAQYVNFISFCSENNLPKEALLLQCMILPPSISAVGKMKILAIIGTALDAGNL